ncbi:hypothetical protein F7725_013553 [Dissostichus mawsoni]|uniref:HECT domain-containing protein n=1 Tax=Dissostichus mawsoni TaxID=36200 RepID=A0A7J5Y477_DISMA|nr:hypothetical protein F7725_013553 [Dissostichus mawsoni]
MIYDTFKLPLVRFYIATQPKSVLHEEAHDDSDCDSFVSEPDLLPQNKQSTLEFTIETNNQLMTDESHDFLLEVFIISEESVTEESFTESSVNRENPASPFANINSDPITLYSTSDPEITFGPAQTGADDNLSDTLIYQPDELPQSPLQILPDITLVLHHSNSFNEVIAAFSDPDIMYKTLKVKRLLPDHSVEKGSGSGVVRDVYSSFWEEFYERCTLGTTVKLPFLRHNLSTATWKAIGRIFVKGFQDCQYMPIKLAPPFLEEMLFGAAHKMKSKEAEVALHLKRYIRELDEEKLARFLRFCTGSNLLTSGQIQVEFIAQSSFTRRPIGRTCGMILQLSDNDDSFPDFRSEFNSILESNIWIMDIV